MWDSLQEKKISSSVSTFYYLFYLFWISSERKVKWRLAMWKRERTKKLSTFFFCSLAFPFHFFSFFPNDSFYAFLKCGEDHKDMMRERFVGGFVIWSEEVSWKGGAIFFPWVSERWKSHITFSFWFHILFLFLNWFREKCEDKWRRGGSSYAFANNY